MARHERDFEPRESALLSLGELLVLLGEGGGDDKQSREDAIACYLSGADGWDEAAKLLGGAFASRAGGLTDAKAD